MEPMELANEVRFTMDAVFVLVVVGVIAYLFRDRIVAAWKKVFPGKE